MPETGNDLTMTLDAQSSCILVIDDDELVRETMVSILEAGGYRVIVAHEGEEGIAKIHENTVDLVITDILMPGKEGIETIAEIRRLHPELRIIAMSGGGEIGRVVGNDIFLGMAEKLGADITLTKPFRMQQITDAVKQLIG